MPANANEMSKAMFMELVIMLSTSAMQQLGKIINPLTGKTELHLEAAQATIDMLEMLSAKTQGNLDHDEERLMKQTISMLQMNYVETAATKAAQAAAPAEQVPAPEPTPADKAPEGAPEPKLHK